MALIFMDGFDKYGGVNANAASAVPLVLGDWTTAAGIQIVAGLSATGFALWFPSGSSLSRVLSANYGRLIGGYRFSSSLGNVCGFQFSDGGTNQCGFSVGTNGIISFRNGSWSSGTILASSVTPITPNSVHYIEWDVTFGASSPYQLWLDGVSIISGTGNTRGSTNNWCNNIAPANSGTTNFQLDDFYLFDNTGSVNNAALLTSPRIETTFPVSDASVQFSFGAATLGNSVNRNGGGYNPGTGVYVRPYTPTRNCTLNSISALPGTTSGTINWRPVVYADVSGLPTGGALLASGANNLGITSGVMVTMPLTTPLSLTAGIQYWLGMQTDTTTSQFMSQDATNTGRFVGQTFGGSAPSTFPSGSSSGTSAVVYGNVTGTGVNYYETASQPPQSSVGSQLASPSYVTDTVATHEDLYNFNSLSVAPGSVYAVAVKAYAAKSDTGTRTVSMRTKSSATDSGGSLTGQAMGTSYQWLGSNFELDPNGNIAWTGTSLNAAQSGFRIDA